MTYHSQPLVKSQTLTGPGANAGKLGLSYIAERKVERLSHFGRVWQFLNRLNICLLYNAAILLLESTHQENENICLHRLVENIQIAKQ